MTISCSGDIISGCITRAVQTRAEKQISESVGYTYIHLNLPSGFRTLQDGSYIFQAVLK